MARIRMAPRGGRMYGRAARCIGLNLCILGFGLKSLAQTGARLTVRTEDAYSAHGIELLRNGDFPGAEAEFRKAVELAPDNAVYLGSLGTVLGMEKKLEESDVYLEKALRFSPNDPAIRRNLASNEFQLGRLRPAEENLERLRKTAPGDPTVTLLLGMVEAELGNYSSAIRLLTSVPDQVRAQPESIVALARAYYRIGKPDQARATLKQLDDHPAGADGVFLGGQVAAQASDFQTAERMFISIASSYREPDKLGYNLALAQYHAGHIQESQATLEKVMGRGYVGSDIYNLMAWCLYKQGRAKEAIASMDKAVALDPSQESNYLDVGMMLIELRRYEGALLAAKKAVEVAPQSFQAYRLLGLAETKEGVLRAAKKAYERAVELNASDQQSILGLASAELADGKVTQAEAIFTNAIQRFPNDAVFYLEYGRMLLTFRNMDHASGESRAIALLNAAIKLNRSLADPHYLLGNLALSEGRTEEALGQLDIAVRLDPNSSKIHYALAHVYHRVGRTEQSAKQLQLFERLKTQETQGSSISPSASSAPTSEGHP
ncbi:MAG: tetratricopeptide repeat protein [Terriglobia bacterium]